MVGGIPVGDAVSEIVGKFQNFSVPRAQAAQQGDSLLGERTKIDGLATLGAGNER